MPARAAMTVIICVFFLAIYYKEAIASASPDDQSNQQLLLQIESLERRLTSQTAELSAFKLRMSRLERDMQSSPTGSSRSLQQDLTKLKNDARSMGSRVGRLETKIGGFNQLNLERDIDRLDQRLSSVQADVQRLKSLR